MFGRQTEIAVAAMGRLAETYDGGRTRLSAADIARDCDLQRPFVAKVLTSLSQARLVSGAPGPGGGYSLTREPSEIPIYEVIRVFEREDDLQDCGCLGWVNRETASAKLVKRFDDVRTALHELMHETTMADFRRNGAQARGSVA